MRNVLAVALGSVLMVGCYGAAPVDSVDEAESSGVIDELLRMTASCTKAHMVSKHTYSDPGSAVRNVPICALTGAVYFNADMDIDCDGRASGGCPGDDPS